MCAHTAMMDWDLDLNSYMPMRKHYGLRWRSHRKEYKSKSKMDRGFLYLHHRKSKVQEKSILSFFWTISKHWQGFFFLFIN